MKRRLFGVGVSLRSVSVALLVVCSFLFVASTYGKTQAAYAGMTLEEALRQLQIQGLNILFSSDLVHSEMTVPREPSAGSLHRVLEEIVQPHGLRIQRGPGNTLLVVPTDDRKSLVSKANGSTNGSAARSKNLAENVVVPFVTVYLTAQDSNNHFVHDLTADDLILREDGKTQRIVEFINFARPQGYMQEFRIPLTVFFLIDSSQSMGSLWSGVRRYDLIRQAALGLLEEFHPDDQMTVVGFNESSWTALEMTHDVEQIRRKLNEQEIVGGRTALFDALDKTMQQIDGYLGRKIIVLCSDGEDNASQTTLEEILIALKSTDVTVLAFGTNAKNTVSEKGREVLEKIGDVSGGHCFFPSAMNDLNTLMDDVRMAMRSQYAAGYTPPDPSIRKWRNVRIDCKNPRVKLRYRKTYLF